MDRSRQTITLHIEGKWSSEEFGRMFLSISDLYNINLFLELLNEESRDFERYFFEMMELRSLRRRRSPRFKLLGRAPLAFEFGGGLPPLWDGARTNSLSGYIWDEERIEVRRITYASPGSTDLTGLGAIVGHIKEFVLKLLERRDLKRHRQLTEQKLEVEIERLRIENAQKLVSLAREVGYSDTECRMLVAHVDQLQSPLVQLVDQRKIVAVTDPEDKTG